MAMEGNCSLEFFPPKTSAGLDKLLSSTLPALSALNPDYCSVTYGAGGATRSTTVATVTALQELGYDVAPHLSFGADDRATIETLIRRYQDQGVDRLVALRGDLPSDVDSAHELIHASELVSLVRATTGDHFDIAVAAYPEIHPEAEGYDRDIHFLKEKLDAGANSAVTQYFYNVEAYFYFLDRCAAAGITQPIHPGIMPPMRTSKMSADPQIRARVIETIPMRREGRIEEVAYANLFLACDESSYITGVEIPVDGGFVAA